MPSLARRRRAAKNKAPKVYGIRKDSLVRVEVRVKPDRIVKLKRLGDALRCHVIIAIYVYDPEVPEPKSVLGAQLSGGIVYRSNSGSLSYRPATLGPKPLYNITPDMHAAIISMVEKTKWASKIGANLLPEEIERRQKLLTQEGLPHAMSQEF